jgi:hypothetical protein
MNILWLIVGLVLGVGGYYLVQKKGKDLSIPDWVLTVLWLGLLLFSISFTVGFLAEPYLNSGRAGGISALIFGGLSLITGVLLFRKIFSIE